MRLLVTGGAGFIGSAVVRLAVGQGHDVCNLDALTYAANLANLASVEDAANYHFAKVDIRDRGALADVFKAFEPEAVMHLAAESHVDRSIDEPQIFIETNVSGTFNVLEEARAHWQRKDRPSDFRLLHVSTDEVFGSLPGETDQLFTEETPYAPRSPYSASKAAADHLVRAWHTTYGLPALLTNCSNNYGPYQFPEKLIPVVILKALAGENIPIYGKGEQIRDWLHVEDHADALLHILNTGTIGRCYNIGASSQMRNIDLVKQICRLLDAKAKLSKDSYADLITFVQDRPGHDARYAIDPSRTEDELNWKARIPLKQGLSQTIDWYLANEDWWRPLLDREGAGARLGLAR